MIDKRILFIDDSPSSLKEQIELIIPRLRSSGINILPEFIDVSEDRFTDSDNKLDLSKVLEIAKSNYIPLKYSVVACDLNLLGESAAGYELLKRVIHFARQDRQPIRRAEFVFYSAQTNKLNEAVLRQDELEKLIRLRITDVFQREKVCGEIGTLVKKQVAKNSFGDYFAQTLSEYSEHTFKSGYPKFKGKKISDVVQEIENGTHHGLELERFFIELTVSNVIKLNIDE